MSARPVSRVRLLSRLGAAVLLAALAVSVADASPDGIGAGASTVRRALRDHALRTLDGRTLTLDGLRGEVVVVSFWASWCPPCRRELARLDELNAEIGRRGGRVVAISVDVEAANARRFAARQRLRMTVAHDGPDGLARTLELSHLPFTMVLDREGQVACTALGASEPALDGLVERTRRLLAAKPAMAEGGTP